MTDHLISQSAARMSTPRPVHPDAGVLGIRILNLKAYLSQCYPGEYDGCTARIDDDRKIWASGDGQEWMIGALPDDLAFAEIESGNGFGGCFIGGRGAIDQLRELDSRRQASLQEYEALTDELFALLTAGLAPDGLAPEKEA